jgi:uncharacterized protein (TIGR02452 family)
MSLRDVAQQTLSILQRGKYEVNGGSMVELEPAIRAAIAGTKVFTPSELADLLQGCEAELSGTPQRVEVSAELTQAAARRLVLDEGRSDLVLLNFASARNVGGGFLNGAKAQEEDLARASALYHCLQAAPAYYEANRGCRHLVYTDHMIWSPSVPFFRVDARELLAHPFHAAVITAPAPNATALQRDWPGELSGFTYEDVLRRRAGMVLALAQKQGHRTLLLGAWGCGVFGNDPVLVADAFGRWLAHPRFLRAFERIVFAVRDPRRVTLEAFEQRFCRP